MAREPKVGDRVRVSFEGRYESPPGSSSVPSCHRLETHDGRLLFVPPEATVEVLASPVYVNHTTTEYQQGDVVRDATGLSFARGAESPRDSDPWLVLGRTTESEWWEADDFLTAPLTLLVRDNEPVPQ
jgi:hypothetical protein